MAGWYVKLAFWQKYFLTHGFYGFTPPSTFPPSDRWIQREGYDGLDLSEKFFELFSILGEMLGDFYLLFLYYYFILWMRILEEELEEGIDTYYNSIFMLILFVTNIILYMLLCFPLSIILN